MIQVSAKLYPYGRKSMERDLATITIFSTYDNQWHVARATLTGHNVHLSKSRPKTKSAHRNLLHVLRDFLNEMDIDSLGKDYITTDLDKMEKDQCTTNS